MGTNYYINDNPCDKCGRGDERIHLGKSSWGWTFSFQYNRGRFYKSVPEMKKWLKGKRIFNEYGEDVTYEDFWEMVKQKQNKENNKHASLYPGTTERVIGGYSFSDCEFS